MLWKDLLRWQPRDLNFILLFSSQWQILPNKVSEASEVEQIQSHSESILLAFLFK